MKLRIINAMIINAMMCAAFLIAGDATTARAQETQAGGAGASASGDVRPGETRVPLAEAATAFDVAGREALGARLRTQSLAGTPEAPTRNSRIVIENRSPFFYNYVSGWATFYDTEGVRCGEGLWKLEAFAPQESVEVDTPGLRLTCTPSTWRIVATNLLTRAGDVAKPREGTTTPSEGSVQQPETATGTFAAPSTTPNSAATVPPLEINVNGKTIPIQLGNPLEISVGKERVRIVVQPVP
ncbi:MAG TPA: hypothetical protein VM934_10580 [Pyrinomonadaceae bacterium]|nr:hypothetical protein [Pyrinomonadaceae bacterium]